VFVSALVRLLAATRRSSANAPQRAATDNGTPAAKDDQARALIDELRPDAGQHGEWRIERERLAAIKLASHRSPSLFSSEDRQRQVSLPYIAQTTGKSA